MGARDRDAERRLDEHRRLVQEEGRRVQRDLKAKINAADMAALRAATEANRLDQEIRHRARSAELTAAVDGMRRQQASLVAALAAADRLHGPAWSDQLDGLDLTGPSADAALRALREELERSHKTATWVAEGFPAPQLPQLPPALAKFVSPLRPPEVADPAPERAIPEPGGIRRQSRREKMIEDAQREADTLAVLLATLDSLQASRRHYEVLAAR